MALRLNHLKCTIHLANSCKFVGGFCTCSIQCWLPRAGLGIFATGVTWEGGMLHERRWDNLQEAPIFRSRNDGCRFSLKPIHWRHKQTRFLRRLKLQKHNVSGILIDVYRIHGFINMIVHMEGYMKMWYTTNSWQLYNYYRETDNPLDVVLFPLIFRQSQIWTDALESCAFRSKSAAVLSAFHGLELNNFRNWMELETYTLLLYGT